MYKQVRGEDLALGDDVTIHFMPNGSCGQRGILQPTESGVVTIKAPGDRILKYKLEEIHHYSQDLPGDPEECLTYGPDCEGPVEMWNPGYGYRSFPRCTYHGERRLRQYQESELERYADSDVAPPGFDPADAGERWDDDY